MAVTYLDFEYRYDQRIGKFDIICMVAITEEKPERFVNKEHMIKFFTENKDNLFIGWNISGAEAQCMCQLMGHEFTLQTQWIDLWVEFKMLTLTHPKYFTKKTGLLAAISAMGLENEYKADKGETLKIILNNITYTYEQMNNILHYCEEDVRILPKIAKELGNKLRRYEVDIEERIRRGRHCRNVAVSQYCRKGFPVDKSFVDKVFGNRDKIKMAISMQCNDLCGFELYVKKYKGKKDNKVLVGASFNFKNFEDYLKSKRLLSRWERTEAGMLRTDEEYMSEMVSNYKDTLSPLYHARNSLKQLSSTDLSELVSNDGYIRGDYWPYNQKTSRTSPKPKYGFLLNLSPWLRMMIKPAKGRAFVGIDFKSQEVLVAAALSNDKAMLEDYLSDIYIGQAVKTGFLPQGATKETHKAQRTAFKPIVLGTQFGMQANSLSIHFFNYWKDLGEEKSMEQCVGDAERFLVKLKKAYHRYYSYLENMFVRVKSRGYYKLSSGYIYFCDSNTRTTQLQNVPCQGNGADMMREAFDECVEKGIYVDPLHDALYFECDEKDAIRKAKVVSKAMVDASIKVLGEEYGQHMSTETQIFTHDQPYFDPRGEEMFKMVSKEIGIEIPSKFVKPKEIPNIHLA